MAVQSSAPRSGASGARSAAAAGHRTGRTPPLLAAFDARIALEHDPVEAACLRAERVGVLARHGDLDAARAEIAGLRLARGHAPHAVVSAWLHLAEGLVLHFAHDGAAARDRLKRSLALAAAVRARPVQALAAAWLAHGDYTRLDIEPMVAHVSTALGNAPGDAHQALSRVALVVAQAFHWAGRMDLALPWYGRSRTHAAAVQDEYMLGAHMHNMAWLRCAHARRVWAAGGDSAAEVARALAGAESSGRYDALTGGAFMGGLAPLLRAQLLLMQGRHAEALAILESQARSVGDAGLRRLECGLLADRAWCRLHTGDAPGALADARAALVAMRGETQIDDRALARTLVSRVLHAVGERDEARLQASVAEADRHALAAMQERLVALLGAALPAP